MKNDFNIEKFLEEEFECKRSGSNIIFCCPFCIDKKYNYWFDVDKEYIHNKTKEKYVGLGHCWSCEHHHSVLTFLMEYKKIDIISALQIISNGKETTFKDLLKKLENMGKLDRYQFKGFDSITYKIPPRSTHNLPKALVDWFVKKRSYPKEMLKWLDVKYCEESETNRKYIQLRNRAIFPIKSWIYQGWQAYLFKPGFYKDGKPFSKTYNPDGKSMSNLLFMYENSKKSKTILIHEGIFDVLRSFTRGYSPVGLLGSHLSPTQAYLLSRTQSEEVCVGLDGGLKEELKAVKSAHLLNEICDKEITIMRLPHGIDPDDVSNKVLNSCFNSRFQFNERHVVFDSMGKISGYNWPR